MKYFLMSIGLLFPATFSLASPDFPQEGSNVVGSECIGVARVLAMRISKDRAEDQVSIFYGKTTAEHTHHIVVKHVEHGVFKGCESHQVKTTSGLRMNCIFDSLDFLGTSGPGACEKLVLRE